MISDVKIKSGTSMKSVDYLNSSVNTKTNSSSDFTKVYDNYSNNRKYADKDNNKVSDKYSYDDASNQKQEIQSNTKDDDKEPVSSKDDDKTVKLDDENINKAADDKDDDKKTTKSKEQQLSEIVLLLFQHNMEKSYSGDASDDVDQNTLKAAMGGDTNAMNALIASLKKNTSALEDILKTLSKDDKLSAQVKNLVLQYLKGKDSQKADLNPADILAAIADQIRSEGGAAGASDMKEFANAIMGAFNNSLNKMQSAGGKSNTSLVEMLMKVKLDETNTNANTQTVTSSNANPESSNTSSENDSKDKTSESYSRSDDDVLKGLIKDDSSNDNKGSKVNMFMNMLKPDTNNAQAVTKTDTVMTVNKNTLVNDVVKSLKYMENNNIKELTVKINPKELGEMIISVTMDAGKLKAEITAQNKEAYNLLMANLADIKENAAGSVKFQDVNVNIYNGDTTFFKDGSQKQNGKDTSDSKSSSTFKKINDEDYADATNEVNDESNINVLA